ncbi:MAG TPA: hypothetical protein VFC44_20410 [Candidatus Saccharimonadales bacterium]|nr:hypothetical protein [Candidatus Saccharimonadales bacterium]
MAHAPKIDFQARLAELRVENDLLRETFALQCEELAPATARIEQGYAVARMVWQNRAMVSAALSFFSRFKNKVVGDLAD